MMNPLTVPAFLDIRGVRLPRKRQAIEPQTDTRVMEEA